MHTLKYRCLVVRALCELVLYDVAHAALGFDGVLRLVERCAIRSVSDDQRERAICAAVLTATCLYAKPVLCMQRAFCTARLLRAHGMPARLVIGYRAVPFLSHAWVELHDRVVNDSPLYQQRLHVLHRA